MHLKDGEKIEGVYHHHYTPFLFNLLKVLAATLPFYLLLFAFQGSLSPMAYFIAHVVVFLLFALIVLNVSLIYWLDKLIVTNMRVVYVDWKLLTLRDEHEAAMHEIQEIQTREKGIFSYFNFFDYGSIHVETASAEVSVIFDDAPDPEGIRQFIFHVRQQQ